MTIYYSISDDLSWNNRNNLNICITSINKNKQNSQWFGPLSIAIFRIIFSRINYTWTFMKEVVRIQIQSIESTSANFSSQNKSRSEASSSLCTKLEFQNNPYVRSFWFLVHIVLSNSCSAVIFADFRYVSLWEKLEWKMERSRETKRANRGDLTWKQKQKKSKKAERYVSEGGCRFDRQQARERTLLFSFIESYFKPKNSCTFDFPSNALSFLL